MQSTCEQLLNEGTILIRIRVTIDLHGIDEKTKKN